jgi:hypothetical protein
MSNPFVISKKLSASSISEPYKIVEGIFQPTEDAKSCGFFYSKEENDLKF